MARQAMTLTQHAFGAAQGQPGMTAGLARLVVQIASGAKRLSREIGRAALDGRLGLSGEANPTGDAQKKLDVFANDVMVEAVTQECLVAGIVSEELDEIRQVECGGDAGYLLCIDPLDGSSNTDINGALGSIFGIYPRASVGRCDLEAELRRKGAEQVAAGYVLYGPSTLLVYTGGQGVHGFSLDPDQGEFVLTHAGIRCPARGRAYSANLSRYDEWSLGLRRFIDHLNQRERTRARRYSLRYTGALIADLHRALLEGGLYLYPADADHQAGKLRLLYECAPLAFVVEQAGGRASTGRQRTLDIPAESIHQRVPLVIGGREEVTLCEKFLAGTHPPAEGAA